METYLEKLSTMRRDRRSGRPGGMDCAAATEVIENLGNGVIGPLEYLRFKRHLKACPDCRASHGRMNAVLEALSVIKRKPAPEGFAASVLERALFGTKDVQPEAGKKALRTVRGTLVVAGIAALGVTLAIAVTVLRRVFSRHYDDAEDGLAALKPV